MTFFTPLLHGQLIYFSQACYKRYATMSEAVGERVLDLHNRVLSLYILQDSGGRPIDDQSNTAHEAGTPSVQGWWLYMNGNILFTKNLFSIWNIHPFPVMLVLSVTWNFLNN